MKYDINLVLSSLRDFSLYERAAASIKPEWFVTDLRNVFLSIKACHEDAPGRVIPWGDIKLRMKGKKGYSRIPDLRAKSKGFSTQASWRNLRKYLQEQLMRDLVEEAAAENETGELKHQDYIKRLEQIQNITDAASETSDFFQEEVTEWIQEEGEVPIVPLCSKELTKALDGGMAAGQIITVLARTDGGKTTLAINVGRNCVQKGMAVLHCSFETSRRDLNKRYACSFTRHTWNWIEAHPKRTQQTIDTMRNHGGYLRIEDYSSVEASTVDIRVAAQNLRKRLGHLDLIIVDSGDDVASTRRYEAEREEAKHVWSELRRLARKLNIPIMVTTQSNRLGAMSGEVELVHIGTSWGKATQSDCVIVLQIYEGTDRAFAIIRKTKRKGKYSKVPIVFDRMKCFVE